MLGCESSRLGEKVSALNLPPACGAVTPTLPFRKQGEDSPSAMPGTEATAQRVSDPLGAPSVDQREKGWA